VTRSEELVSAHRKLSGCTRSNWHDGKIDRESIDVHTAFILNNKRLLSRFVASHPLPSVTAQIQPS
jgi:hypothetical protein